MRGIVVVMAALLAAACTQRPVQAFPSDLREHAAELSTRGHADIQTVDDGVVRISAGTRVSVAQGTGDGAQLIRELTIRELVAGCTPDVPGDCLASQVIEREMVVGTKKVKNVGGGITSAVSALAGLALVGTCLAECENKDILIGTGLVIAGAGLFVLMMATMK
jgi:hypothetical protein